MVQERRASRPKAVLGSIYIDEMPAYSPENQYICLL